MPELKNVFTNQPIIKAQLKCKSIINDFSNNLSRLFLI